MSVAKVIEISSTSPKSFEDAIALGIKRASTTVQDIRGAWVKEFKIDVENGAVAAYRVDMKVTFIIHE